MKIIALHKYEYNPDSPKDQPSFLQCTIVWLFGALRRSFRGQPYPDVGKLGKPWAEFTLP